MMDVYAGTYKVKADITLYENASCNLVKIAHQPRIVNGTVVSAFLEISTYERARKGMVTNAG